MDNAVRSISVEEFARRLRATTPDKRFALFLGAGCSVTSGIPAAGTIVTDRWIPRLRDFQAPDRTDLALWASEVIPGYDPSNPAQAYGELIERLFITPEERQREIEILCEGRTPGFGYAVLAQLVALEDGRFNIVLTTNFDDLIADALYLYTEARPLVIHHESLATFIRPTRTRPLVVKLHGDHRLSPRNTSLETRKLEQETKRHTEMVLHDRGLIFLGYAGADRGVLQFLNDLPAEALPYGAYWVHPHEPDGPIRDWLIRREGVWVRSGWFDEVMLVVRDIFDMPHPREDRFTRIFQDYHNAFLKLSASIRAKSSDEAGLPALQKALSDTEALLPGQWRIIAEANRLGREDPDRAEALYRDGINQFPDEAPLLGNYALFLAEVRKDYDAAEGMYKRALAADPTQANNICNYAIFLLTARKDSDAAEKMFERAIAANPTRANSLGTYALFLQNARKSYDAAETMFKQALAIDSSDAGNVGNYAVFLSDIRKDYEAAETMLKRALELDPKNSDNLRNYAAFLLDIRKDPDTAETVLKRALAADPRNAATVIVYAHFLEDVRKDYDAAEAMLKRAIALEPHNADYIGRYAVFLRGTRKNYDLAEAAFNQALEVDSKHAGNIGEYARFLYGARKDFVAAEAMFRRALEADPTHVRNLDDFALFFQYARRDHDSAESLFKRALDADPACARTMGNYALFLQEVRKNYDAAEVMYRRALGVDAQDPDILGNYARFLQHARANYSAAGVMFRRALEADPSHAWNIFLHAGLLLTTKDYPAAEAMLKRAISADSSKADFFALYGAYLFTVKGDKDAGQKMFSKALSLDPAQQANIDKHVRSLQEHRSK